MKWEDLQIWSQTTTSFSIQQQGCLSNIEIRDWIDCQKQIKETWQVERCTTRIRVIMGNGDASVICKRLKVEKNPDLEILES